MRLEQWRCSVQMALSQCRLLHRDVHNRAIAWKHCPVLCFTAMRLLLSWAPTGEDCTCLTSASHLPDTLELTPTNTLHLSHFGCIISAHILKPAACSASAANVHALCCRIPTCLRITEGRHCCNSLVGSKVASGSLLEVMTKEIWVLRKGVAFCRQHVSQQTATQTSASLLSSGNLPHG